MNFCPPNPGLTLMISSRSQSLRKGSAASIRSVRVDCQTAHHIPDCESPAVVPVGSGNCFQMKRNSFAACPDIFIQDIDPDRKSSDVRRTESEVRALSRSMTIGSVRQIRHEVPVHHVQMVEWQLSCIDFPDFATEVAEIAFQHGWCNHRAMTPKVLQHRFTL